MVNNGNTKTGVEKVNINHWISTGWDLVFSAPAEFILITLIYVIVIGVASSTAVAEFLVWGPLNVGFYYVILEKLRGRPVKIGDVAKGFNFFVAAVLSNILISFFAAIGYTLCIIPGIIISALYLFTPLFILEKNMDFWTAMEASRKIASKYVFELSVFVFLQFLILLAGLILCGIGILIAIPIIMAATAVAYDELVGISKE